MYADRSLGLSASPPPRKRLHSILNAQEPYQVKLTIYLLQSAFQSVFVVGVFSVKR